jgi:hypothetical protein
MVSLASQGNAVENLTIGVRGQGESSENTSEEELVSCL